MSDARVARRASRARGGHGSRAATRGRGVGMPSRPMLLFLGGFAVRRSTTLAESRLRSSGGASIVLLGQSLNADASVPPLLEARINSTVALLARHASSSLIATGGDPAGAGKTEADVMAELLTRAGVPRSSIMLEPLAENTVQNALLSLPLIPSNATVIHLVTSDFHMPRASYLFEAAAAAAGRADQLRVRPHPTHAMGDASKGASGINTQSRKERLSLELRMLREDFVQRHLPTHGDAGGLGLGPLAPLPPERLRRAIDEVREMLDAKHGSHSERREDGNLSDEL